MIKPKTNRETQGETKRAATRKAKKEIRKFTLLALEMIESSKHRMTKSRKSLLLKILEQREPFSAPHLVKLLSIKDACDPVTVYRTLPVFEELGIIEKCDFSDDMAKYEVSLGHSGHHHHHVVCNSCHTVESLDFCVIDAQEQILKKWGYTGLRHRLEFSGKCPSCS